jgi:hypothetical protein
MTQARVGVLLLACFVLLSASALAQPQPLRSAYVMPVTQEPSLPMLARVFANLDITVPPNSNSSLGSFNPIRSPARGDSTPC